MAFDFVSAFPNAGALITEGVTEHQSPQQITIRFSPGVEIDPASLGGIVVTRSGGSLDPFGNSNDIVVTPGSITVDDLPNENQVIVRFAETLPDDSYRITISGAGVTGLKTLAQINGAATVPAENFRSGGSFQLNFRLDLGGAGGVGGSAADSSSKDNHAVECASRRRST